MKLCTILLTLTAGLATCSLLPTSYSAPDGQPDAPPLNATLPHVREIPQRANVLGYQREAFGQGWARAGRCTVREEQLEHWLDDPQLTNSCTTVGSGADPYGTGTMTSPGGVELDHVVPLRAAWDLGAFAWPAERRLAFANDPLNLVVTSKEENQAKSDALPSRWQPSDRFARCWYARRVAQVAATYELPLPQEDHRAIRRACLIAG